MKQSICAALLLCAACSSCIDNENPASFDPGVKRKVPVCIVTDSMFPVPDSIVGAITTAVFADYDIRTGIVFRIIERRRAFANLNARSDRLIRQLIKICSAKSELRFVFSDQQKHDTLGLGNVDYGFAIIFQAKSRYGRRDRGGHMTLVSSLKHEIGHVFGAGHSADTLSFMYPYATPSHGECVSDVLRVIFMNKWRRWFPYTTQTPLR